MAIVRLTTGHCKWIDKRKVNGSWRFKVDCHLHDCELAIFEGRVPTVMTLPSQGRMGIGCAMASVRASEIDDLHKECLLGGQALRDEAACQGRGTLEGG